MKLASLALCLFAACSAIAAPPSGERVRYTIQFATGTDEAALKQVIAAYETRLEKLASAAQFTPDTKTSTIAVELPLRFAFSDAKPECTLDVALGAELHPATVPSSLEPEHDGLAHLDDEWLRLHERACDRGLFGSQVAAHAAGAKLQLFRDDLVHTLLGARGELEFLVQANSEFLSQNGTTLTDEHERFLSWCKSKPSARLAEFDALAREHGGPLPGCVWRRLRASEEHVLLVRSSDPRFRFTGKDIASTGFSQDQMGYPAVSFEFSKERRGDFGDWTQQILARGLAIVLDEEVVTLANVRSRLPGGGIIEGGVGGFSKGEVQALVRLMRLSPLPLQPQSLTTEFLH
jgi:hypothetical protein